MIVSKINQSTSNPSFAWVTLCTTRSYLPGILVLARSLRQCQSRYPLVVMVTHDLLIDEAASALTQEPNIRQRLVSPIQPSPQAHTEYAYATFSEVWTKLRCWELVEFAKLVFLDADMLVLRNMDHLFEIELAVPSDELVFSNSTLPTEIKSNLPFLAAVDACVCNPLGRPNYPSWWVPENCRHSHVTSGITPLANPGYFNSGLFVFHPNVAMANDMVNKIQTASENLSRYLFPDQDFLNDYFKSQWLRLPYVYNAMKTMKVAHPDLWNLQNIHNLHYIINKPWNIDIKSSSINEEQFYDLYEIWWDFSEGATRAP
ncbi:glycosyltransferase family 8 protein [Microcoleus sp. B9-D4]|uniref:glycosyltransferase family 8 protein n=1 Tax=Microcoleus sp. B9-D4 TaxID=2818711 RepID=UPI002FCEEB6F